MQPFFADLVKSTDEYRRAFECHPKLMDAVANGMDIARYTDLLLELYHVVWHFNPVCAAAAARLGSPTRDPDAALRYFLYKHMQEEAGHEHWVLNDLEAIGVNRTTALEHRPAAYTLALNGYNYWSAAHRHPASVLGMLYTLEVIASVYGGPFASAMRESLSLEDERGISFINSHASLDARHMAELRQVLNQVNEGSAREAIVESVQVNFHHLTRVFQAV